MTPATAAITAPTTMASASRATSPAPVKPRLMEAMMPEKAPTLMKPAWPRDSSPRIPTVRFRDTAMQM